MTQRMFNQRSVWVGSLASVCVENWLNPRGCLLSVPAMCIYRTRRPLLSSDVWCTVGQPSRWRYSLWYSLNQQKGLHQWTFPASAIRGLRYSASKTCANIFRVSASQIWVWLRLQQRERGSKTHRLSGKTWPTFGFLCSVNTVSCHVGLFFSETLSCFLASYSSASLWPRRFASVNMFLSLKRSCWTNRFILRYRF